MPQQALVNQQNNKQVSNASPEKEAAGVSAAFSKVISAAPPAMPNSGSSAIQRAVEEDDELLQAKFSDKPSGDQADTPSFSSTIQRKKGNGGLPDQLKSGIENLSGYSMDDVRVHYNSPNPQQLQAHAYAQGSDIHVAPGQEQHLPHEAWHVVQQRQGRVKPTMQYKRMNINDDNSLEREADTMGAKAMQSPSSFSGTLQKKSVQGGSVNSAPVQLMLSKEDMISLSGPPGSSRGLYAKILNVLDEYAKNKKPHKGIAFLYKLDRLVKEWLTKHTLPDGKFAPGQDTLRGRYLKDMPAEIEAEKNLMSEEGKGALGDKLPSNTIKARKEKADAVRETTKTNAKVGGAKARHKFSVVAYVQHPDYGKFAKERMSMTLKNKMKPMGKKSTKDIKDAAAKKVVEDKEAARTDGKQMTHQEKIEAIRRLGGAGVGHTFVEFQRMSPAGEELTKQTFGFAPAIPAPPKEPTPGAVASPDPHANEKTVKRMTFDVAEDKYNLGINKAAKLMQTPPNYVLIGYNCTLFAKDIADTIGVGFPQNAFLAVPFSGKIWNPNDLYDSIEEYG